MMIHRHGMTLTVILLIEKGEKHEEKKTKQKSGPIFTFTCVKLVR